MVICGRDARHMLAGNISQMFGKVSQCVATENGKDNLLKSPNKHIILILI